MDSTLHSTPVPDPRDKKKFYFADTSQRRAIVSFIRFIFSLIMEMDEKGLEHFPEDGPVIIAANHVTSFDVFPMQFALPRPISFMGDAPRREGVESRLTARYVPGGNAFKKEGIVGRENGNGPIGDRGELSHFAGGGDRVRPVL